MLGQRFIAFSVGVVLITTVCHAQWQTSTIRQLDSGNMVVLPAQRQDVSKGWNRIAQIPYMVYMPERDRVLMLLNRDKPLEAMTLSSDDHGATWSEPRYVQIADDGKPDTLNSIGTGLAYLGKGLVLIALLLLAGPVTAHALGSAAYRVGIPLRQAIRNDLAEVPTHRAQEKP